MTKKTLSQGEVELMKLLVRSAPPAPDDYNYSFIPDGPDHLAGETDEEYEARLTVFRKQLSKAHVKRAASWVWDYAEAVIAEADARYTIKSSCSTLEALLASFTTKEVTKKEDKEN